MWSIRLCVHLVVLLMAVICHSLSNVVSTQSALQRVEYAPSGENFANPERGFYRRAQPLWIAEERRPITDRTVSGFRQEGITILRTSYVIDEFREAPLSRGALDTFAADLNVVRRAGLKMIPRFMYNFPMGKGNANSGQGKCTSMNGLQALLIGTAFTRFQAYDSRCAALAYLVDGREAPRGDRRKR
jgi:hypothetical protein